MTPLYDITSRAYEIMREGAQPTEHDELTYTGKLTEVHKAAGGSSRYYSLVRELLLSPAIDPCIEIRQRGNDSQPSIIVLRHPPPSEWQGITPSGLTRLRGGATLGELEKRVAAFERWREETFREVNLRETLLSMERRLSQLELKLGERDSGTEET